MGLRVQSRSALCLSLAAVAGCAMQQEPPGELVGAYRVEGALVENSCGSNALPAADPLRFDVEIRKQDDSGLWLVDPPPPHPGSLADDGEFRFERQATYDVGARQPVELLVEMDIERLADPDAAQQLGDPAAQPCRLTVSERIEGTLLRDGRIDDNASDASDDPAHAAGDADLVATNEIAVQVAGGSDCRASLDENGGPFERLPCDVRYELAGELIER